MSFLPVDLALCHDRELNSKLSRQLHYLFFICRLSHEIVARESQNLKASGHVQSVQVNQVLVGGLGFASVRGDVNDDDAVFIIEQVSKTDLLSVE